VLKPSERDPSAGIRVAELLAEASLPPGVFNVVNGDKEAVDVLLHSSAGRRGQLCRLDADRPLHLPDRRRERKAKNGAILRGSLGPCTRGPPEWSGCSLKLGVGEW
jgi:hypothetical protein